MNDKDKPLADDAERSGAPHEAVERVATHSAGVAAGGVAGAVAGAAGGLAAGPVGSVVGAVAGALAGGAAGATGRGVELDPDPAPHLGWWRDNFASRRYASGRRYEDFEPAYRFGTLAYLRSERPRPWAEVANDLHGGWIHERGESRMEWQEAEPAVRDAWERLHDPEHFR